jgi:hypothetical protein
MKRYRWLKARWPISMRVLAKRLRTKAFDGEQVEGFVLDRVRDDFLDARFVEKIEYDDTVTDPFGVEASFHRVEYRSCEFRAALAGPGLELLNAPRSVQAMISRLAEVTDFTLAISPLSVNVLDWASEVQRRLNVEGVVDSLQLAGMELASSVQAKAVIKGSVDVLEATQALVLGRKHVIEKVQIRFMRPKRLTMLLTNNGVARFDQEPSEDLLSIVRESLPL